MYRSFFLSLLLLLSFGGYAQSSIKGIAIDVRKTPMPGCRVRLLHLPDSAQVQERITDSTGVFLFSNVPAGVYAIDLQMAGYARSISRELRQDGQSQLDAGALVLGAQGKDLQEAVVTAYKPNITFKNGTLVMNVENNPLASGMTVLELLRLVPGVLVDGEGNVTINGRSNVSFMMNGRLQQIPAKQLVALLGGMSAETIASLELIKNPSAKYDAAGTAGIINIVAKKVRVRGFSGNVSENVSYGRKFGSVTSGTLNFKSDKLTVFTYASYWYRDIVNEMNTDRSMYTGPHAGTVSSRLESTDYKRVFTARALMEYELAPKITLGVGAGMAPSSSNVAQLTRTTAGGAVALGYDHIHNDAYNAETYNSPSATVYTLYADSLGTQIRFNADYTRYHNDFSGLTRSTFFNGNNDVVRPMLGYKNILGLDFGILTQRLDVAKKLGKTLSLETGVKASFVNNNSDFTLAGNAPGTDVYFTDSSASNLYNYKERILAGYVGLLREKGSLSVQAGVRAEQTNVDALNNTNGYKLHQDYLNLFPSASVGYKVNDKHALQLTYSYRIDRPGYEQLNPMRIFNDPLNYSTGNPRLLPQYSHAIGMEHSLRGFLTNSLSYNRLANSQFNYSYLDTSFVQVDTSVNYSAADQFTYALSVQMPVGKKYNVQASGSGIWGARYGIINGVNTNISTFLFMGNMNNDLVLTKTTKLQVNLMYCTPFNDGIQHYKSRGSLDVAVQKKLLKNKLTATLQINDLLYTNIMRYRSELPGQAISMLQKADSRRLRLVVNYRFGNMRVDRKMRTENEEAKRIHKTNG